jgi:alpha,alpha-trehalase
MTTPRPKLPALVLSLFLVPASLATSRTAPAVRPSPKRSDLDDIQSYIRRSWDVLTRSMSDCATITDPKVAGESVLYLPADFPEPPGIAKLRQTCKFQVEHLPKVIRHPGEIDPSTLGEHGLLYLEHPYVVPGGRFNEMYGWDSYFIIRGLIADGRLELARGMVENFFFEIEHYGNVLNANRSYYLSRSQQPFLTSMIMAVYDALKAQGREDRAWLDRAYGYAVRDHEMWVQPPHLAGDTGLSRYFDRGQGPSPESIKDETGHYRQVVAYFLERPDFARTELVFSTEPQNFAKAYGGKYSVTVCEPPTDAVSMTQTACNTTGQVALSSDFYKGDRSMRESGYDISFRFGPFGAETHHFAAVCLNSLLYKVEEDLARMSAILDRNDDEQKWRRTANARKANINKYLWDAQRGQFFDYNFETKQLSSYNYMTTFYPLWVGLATQEQAHAIVKNISIFERPGGLAMSATDSGVQWDFPYAWAPNQLIADEGMRHYGFDDDASRAAFEFLSNVAQNFRRDGTIREKYNAVTRSSEVAVKSGYQINVVGFGWTNGVFINLLGDLSKPLAEKLAQESRARSSR